MAYTHQMIEYPLTTTAGDTRMSATAAAQMCRLGFGMNNYVLAGVAFAPTTTAALPVAAVLSVRKATVGAASATAGHQYSVTMVTGANQGKWRQRIDTRVTVTAGEEVVVQVTTLCSSATLRGVAYVVPDWETGGNMTNVTTVTA